ncbi:hypothetical protein AB0465_39915 [Streptomyces griseoviridis]
MVGSGPALATGAGFFDQGEQHAVGLVQDVAGQTSMYATTTIV